MNLNKKAAIVIYPQFSNYEISIAAAIFKIFDKQITVFSKDKNPVLSEEGFQFLPNKTLGEFNIEDYDCLILPGMWDFTQTISDENYISFLRQFKGNKNIIIASISSSPILLYKAGVLDEIKFCASLFEEDIDKYNIDRKNIVRVPIYIDDNIITAAGRAYREFGIAIGQRLGLDVSENSFSGIKYPFDPNDYIFYRK